MSYHKTKGIVLREVSTGEADKIITIFSKSYGKITAAARGARRPKSRLIAGTQFISYSDFVLFRGKEMYNVNSCELIESFYPIRNDVVRLAYAAHIVDIVNDVVQENQPSFRVLQLFLNSLHMLSKTEKNPELITRIFELRILSILGYAPFVKGCMVCGKEQMEQVFFSFGRCGFICGEGGCVKSDSHAVKVSSGAARAICHIVHSKMENLFGFELSQGVLKELGRITGRYLREKLEKNYTKLDYLKTLQME